MERRVVHCALRFVLVIGLLLGAAENAAVAGSPRVTFDVGSLVACRDVTTPEFSKANPGERLVEARFAISSLLQDGKPDDLVGFMIRLECPERTAEVVDFSPKTLLTSDYAGTLTYEKKDEHNQRVGVDLKGEFNHLIKVGGTGENGDKENTSLRYELLPPMEQLSAAGTFGRGHGVYFKLKPSRRTSLEGAKEFMIVLRVPAAWRGDYVYLKCEATGYRRGMVQQFDQETRWGSRSFIVPLYLEGDSQARHAADEFVAAEANLRRAAAAQLAASKNRSKTAKDSFSALFTPSPAKPKTEWLDRLVFGSIGAGAAGLDASLPADVRAWATEFTAAKRQMFELSQSAATHKISG